MQQAKKIESSPNVTVVRINNEFGLGTAKAFTQALEKLGGKVNAEEILEPSGSDYRAIITRMRAHPGNLVYLGVYPNEGAVFLRQAKELGLKGPFLSSVAILGAKNFFQLVGEGTKDLYVASSTPAFIESDSTEMKEFVSRYREKFGAEPSVEQIYAARSYDGLRAIATAQKSCGEHEADCLKDALFLVHDLKGPSGSIRFDRNGDVTSTFSLLTVNGNSFELVR